MSQRQVESQVDLRLSISKDKFQYQYDLQQQFKDEWSSQLDTRLLDWMVEVGDYLKWDLSPLSAIAQGPGQVGLFIGVQMKSVALIIP